MNKRKDYIYLMNQEINTKDKEISYDFSGNNAEMQYCSGSVDRKDEVIITNGEYERDAIVFGFQDGVVSFELCGDPRPSRGPGKAGLNC